MKNIIIEIKTMNVPSNGMLNGGWYEGRQYWNGKLGYPGEIIAGKHSRYYAKEMTARELQSFNQILHNHKIFIVKK